MVSIVSLRLVWYKHTADNADVYKICHQTKERTNEIKPDGMLNMNNDKTETESETTETANDIHLSVLHLVEGAGISRATIKSIRNPEW